MNDLATRIALFPLGAIGIVKQSINVVTRPSLAHLQNNYRNSNGRSVHHEVQQMIKKVIAITDKESLGLFELNLEPLFLISIKTEQHNEFEQPQLRLASLRRKT